MDWQALFDKLTNKHHQPLIPAMFGIDSNRHSLPVQDFFLEQMHRPNQGEGHIPVGQGFNGMRHDLNDQWKEMLQRRMWNQFNSQSGQMGRPSVNRVDGRMPMFQPNTQRPMNPPITGYRG